MALAQKYDLIAQSKKYKDIYRLKLSKEGYMGSVIDRDMPREKPFRIIRDKEKVICGTTLEFGMIAWTDFELLELYTSNCREWLAELYLDNYHKNLLTGWTNHSYTTFEAFGTRLTEVMTAEASGKGYSNVLGDLKKGQSVTVQIHIRNYTTAFPYVYLSTGPTIAEKSNYVQLVEGANLVTLVTTEDIDDAVLIIETDEGPVDFDSGYEEDVEVVMSPELIFKGFVVAEFYQEEYKPAPLAIRFSATDGLGLLKEEDFTLTGRKSQLEILRHCIDKIGLSIGYSIAIGLHEENMDATRTPLAQAYENATLYLGKNCYEVIEHILEKYSSTISQYEGRWYITRQPDRKMTRLLYSSAGVYEGTANSPGVLSIARRSVTPEAYPVGSPLMLSMEPARKSVKIIQNLSKKLSFLDNHKFEVFDGSSFEGWTTAHTVEQREHDGIKYLFYPGWSFSYLSIYQELNLSNLPGAAFIFKAKISAIGIRNPRPNVVDPIPDIVIRMAVWFDNGTTIWFLTDTGWTDTPTAIERTIAKSAYPFPEWTDVSIVVPGLPSGTGTLRVNLYKIQWALPLHIIQSSLGLAFTDIIVTMEKFQGFPEEIVQVHQINTAALQRAEDLNVMQADIPDVINNTAIWGAYMSLSSGTPTRLWKRIGESAIYNLLSHYALVLENNSVLPRMILEGSLRGRNISFESLLKHEYNSAREFEIVSGDWDIYDDKWTLNLLEYYAWNPPETIVPVITLDEVQLPAGIISGGDIITAQVKLSNSSGTFVRAALSWQLLNSVDTVLSSGTILSAEVTPGDSLWQSITEISIPEVVGTYRIKVWLTDHPSVAAIYSSNIIIPEVSSTVTCTSVGTISNGGTGLKITVPINYTNSGAAGNAAVEWRIYEGASLYDTGEVLTNFPTGSGSLNVEDIFYPEQAGTYTLQVKISTDVTWRVSNEFDVEFS